MGKMRQRLSCLIPSNNQSVDESLHVCKIMLKLEPFLSMQLRILHYIIQLPYMMKLKDFRCKRFLLRA